MNMNSSNLLILNGLKSKAQSTFVHISREASSVVDYICADESTFKKSSDLFYRDFRELLETDHLLVGLDVEVLMKQNRFLSQC
jgi:hypothetical protein